MSTSVSLPFASIPVRGRVAVAAAVRGASDELAEAVLTTVLLAGVVTGGTVLARGPLRVPEHIVRRVRRSVADTGAYVVSSAAGLTATSRATGGELAAFRCTVPAHLLALYAVAAARASGACVLTRSAGSTAAAEFARLGLRARGDGCSVVVEPGFVTEHGIIGHGGDVYTVLSALLIGLLRSDTQIIDTVPLDERLPNFLESWSALLVADEFLLPGSALVPSDYLRRP
ncbi:hypothetical protein OG874_21060 [Nocardia sp. NBC_00565]|uniref:hypothetical protein n=1 Tax=Nocardia sp. NBC_00565 TaxID=2975993 RepID=UPI002E8033BB|nr:hypothetical protein [Nocardia sp. NBC_00565]WUC07425.1 hypothetical protein OG874_21060 [Nocardia sp. NBC_00565]